MTAQGTVLSDERETLNVLYYGAPGVGKTVAAAHMAKLGKVIFVDAEKGLKARPLRALGVDVARINVRHTATYAALEALSRELDAMLKADPQAVTGVVLDSLSEIQRYVLEGDVRGLFHVTQADYGTNTMEMRALIRRFRDLSCHTVFTAHVRRDEDADTGLVRYGPSLTPAVGGDLLAYVDIACYVHMQSRADSDEPDYVGEFRPIGRHVAKDRFGALPPRLVNPTFDRILAYVDGTFRREAQRETDSSDNAEAVEGLDAEQLHYRQKLMAAKAAARPNKEAQS